MLNVAIGGTVLSDFQTYESATEGIIYFLLSNTTMGDQPFRAYYYVASATDTVDNNNVLENVTAGGRYFKIPTDLTVVPPTVTRPIRTLNSSFTVSSTKVANVAYSVSLSVTNPLLAGSSTANAFLEYSVNSGTTWLLVSQASNSSAVGVAVAIAITNVQTSVISGVIPANALVRLRTTTTGTGSATFIASQEVVY